MEKDPEMSAGLKTSQENLQIVFIFDERRPWIDSVNSAGLVIERSAVRVLAEAAGEVSSPGSPFCAGSNFGIRSTPVVVQ